MKKGFIILLVIFTSAISYAKDYDDIYYNPNKEKTKKEAKKKPEINTIKVTKENFYADKILIEPDESIKPVVKTHTTPKIVLSDYILNELNRYKQNPQDCKEKELTYPKPYHSAWLYVDDFWENKKRGFKSIGIGDKNKYVTKIWCIVTKDGEIKDVKIYESSGNDIYDAYALYLFINKQKTVEPATELRSHYRNKEVPIYYIDKNEKPAKAIYNDKEKISYQWPIESYCIYDYKLYATDEVQWDDIFANLQ